MVKRIKLVQKDKIILERLKKFRDVTESYQPENYKNKVVLKPWGYEYLIFENEHVAIWFLHIKYGHSTSMHCHPEKKTSLILLSGSALCNTIERRNYLNSIDAIILEKGVFHSTKALSPEGVDIIEIETPPNKTDLVRLNDEYGRESSGYEGLTQMYTENLDEFNYFYFENLEPNTTYTYTSPLFEIFFEEGAKSSTEPQDICFEENAIYCLCKGQLLNTTGKIALDIGDAEEGKVLQVSGIMQFQNYPLILKVIPGKKFGFENYGD